MYLNGGGAWKISQTDVSDIVIFKLTQTNLHKLHEVSTGDFSQQGKMIEMIKLYFLRETMSHCDFLGTQDVL